MKYAFTLLAIALSAAIQASAATNYYLATPFTGTTQHPGCVINNGSNQIQLSSSTTITADNLQSFSFGGTSTSKGLGAPNINFQNIVISKSFDHCSGALFTTFVTGTVLPTVTIYGVDPSGTSTKLDFIHSINPRGGPYSQTPQGDSSVMRSLLGQDRRKAGEPQRRYDHVTCRLTPWFSGLFS